MGVNTAVLRTPKFILRLIEVRELFRGARCRLPWFQGFG